MSTGNSDQTPVARLRIVRGEPTPEEVAVLTALVSAGGNGVSGEAAPPVRGGWSDPASRQRVSLAALAGRPGAWRSAGR